MIKGTFKNIYNSGNSGNLISPSSVKMRAVFVLVECTNAK